MELKVLHYFLLIGFTMFGIITNSLSFNPIRFHCDNYILNTYLYFILSWGILLATNASLYDRKIELHDIFSGPFTILLMVSSLALLIGLLFIPPSMFFTKHLLYIIQMVMLGIIMYPYYKNNREQFNQVGLTTLLMLIFLTIISVMFQDLISDRWENYLIVGLLSLIIARFIEIFKNINYDSTYSRIVTYASILIFSLFIMVDTKKIIVNAENCINPDYINESINLFLDSINLFQNLYTVRSD